MLTREKDDGDRAAAATELSSVWSPRLSSEQLRFYFLHQMNPADPDIYVCRILRITGELDAGRLRRSVAELARRHDILRSRYPLIDGHPRIALAASEDGAGAGADADDGGAAVAAFDLSSLAPAERAARAEEIVAAELHIAEPFELERGPLLRLTAIALAPAAHIVVLRFHHLIADGASVRLFAAGLWETYASLEPGAPPPAGRPAHQFRDFIEWEHRRDTREARALHRTYWAGRLAGARPIDLAVALAPGRRRPERHTRAAGTVHAALGEELRASLRAFCQAQRVTPYMVMLAVLQQLLHQITGERDLLVGTPVAYRQRRELQAMLGVQVSWIAMRGQVAPEQTFLDLLLQIRRELPSAYVHQGSYESLIAAAGAAAGAGAGAAGTLARDPSRNPLLQVTLNHVRHDALPAPPGLTIEMDPVELFHTAYDLSLRFEELNDSITLGLTYYEGAMDRATAERLGAAFLALAAHCLAHPELAISAAPPLALAPSSGAAAAPAPAAPARRIVVAATFTAEPLQPVLEHWLERLGLSAELAFAPFDQLFQQLVDPHSLVARNPHGPNVLLVRCEDWKDPEAGLEELLRLLATHAERSPAPTLVVVCPPSAARRTPGPDPFAAAVVAAAAASPRLHALDWQDVLARYPVESLDDAEADAYARAPYSAEATVALGTAIARKLHAMLRPAPKVLVLDCDHTLWRGVAGEDGPRGLVVDEGHRALQQLAVEQHGAGVLLCLASKNNQADVWEAFATVPGMLLRREMIAAHRIDWAPKSQNLRALAAELNLGVDSFVFLDDSPAECAEVRAHCPAALVLQVPPSAELPHFLRHLWPLDPRKLTETDRQRAALYAADARRQQLRAETPDLAKFLATLEVQTGFHALTRENLARAAQMTQRTNQFNTTTVRRSEAELLELAADGHELLLVEVADRFGDYGLVGLVIFRRPEEGQRGALEVSSWMLSCRALGRGVEHRILAELGRLAAARGLARVDIAFRPTAKNLPARQFLDAIAAPQRMAPDPDGLPGGPPDGQLTASIPIAEALTAGAKPATIAAAAEAAETAEAAEVALPLPAETSAPSELWQAVATQLDTVAKIRRAIASSSTSPRSAPSPFVAPRDELERALARGWAEALLVEAIGVDDDYFAIGGDSIRSLAVVAELRRAGLQVTVRELHEHPTVAQLAALLRPRAAASAAASAATGAAATGSYPLSFSQRYVVASYARHNLRAGAPPSGVFHLQERLAVREPRRRPSMTALRRALEQLVRHTALLHTEIFDEAGAWKQRELASYPDLLESFELAHLPEREQQAELERILVEDRRRPFDPARSGAAMIRTYAVVTGAHTFELIVTAHHGFCDGWSLQNAYGQLFSLYDAYQRDDEPRAAELGRALAELDGGFRELVHREQLALAATPPQQPQPRLPLLRSEAAPGEQQMLVERADWALVERAVERARRSRTSLKAVLLDAFAAALSVPSPSSSPSSSPPSSSPLVVAVVTNGRADDLPRPMDVFGLCWTFAPILLPADPSHRSLPALHRELLAAEANARSPIEQRFHGADPETVVHASFNFTSFHNASWRTPTDDLHLAKREAFHRFPFPLDFNVRLDEPARTASLVVRWTQGTFDERSAAALLAAFAAALA